MSMVFRTTHRDDVNARFSAVCANGAVNLRRDCVIRQRKTIPYRPDTLYEHRYLVMTRETS
jgi:hypothetical protein